MMIESGLPQASVEVLPNPVDVERFRQVRSLPRQARRALFYNSRIPPDSAVVGEVRKAAVGAGLDLDFIGRPFGKTIEDPETVLPGYDIVFASGISAIEAVACGCAVIVLGLTSCGEMVRPENFEKIRGANFSIAVNSPKPDAERIAFEIGRYSPEQCSEVSMRLRSESGLDVTSVRLLEIYDGVIAEHQDCELDLPGEMAAVADYFRKVVPIVEAASESLMPDWGGLGTSRRACPVE